MAAPVQMGRNCQVHRHRELVPLERHHIWPKAMGGPDTPDNLMDLCANAHGSAHNLLTLMLRARLTGKPVPWTIRRLYGKGVRAVAQRGYDAIVAHSEPPGA